MTTPFRWGILGTGVIATKFGEGLKAAPDAELVAVGSRTKASADAFGHRFGLAPEGCHGSYESLVADPRVDAIYVSSPHSGHRDHTLLCLDHGKAVLCEKPFAINAADAAAMAARAQERGVFLMEAMWTRFNPVMVRLRELLAEGAFGDVRFLQADFGFRTEFNPTGRLFAPALGGGALLDVGVYCVSLAHMVFGGPAADCTGLAALGATGVDEQSAWVFRYDDGALAVMSSAVRTETPQDAVICGTDAMVRIPDFWHPTRLILRDRDLGQQEERFEVVGNGYNYEAEEVARCVREGLVESPVLPLAETVAIMTDLDRIRGQWGLVYPGEA